MKLSDPVLVAAVVTLLAGCTSAPDGPGARTGPATAPQPAASPTASPTASPAALLLPMRCGTPTDTLVRRGIDVLGNSGAVTATTLVPATVTDTGAWFVLGFDQEQPVGDGSRSTPTRALAITDADARHATVINLTSAPTARRHHANWARVNWTGDTLAQGKLAVARAVSCLDRTG